MEGLGRHSESELSNRAEVQGLLGMAAPGEGRGRVQPHVVGTDDIDELFSWVDDWGGRYWQLEPGPLGYRSIHLPLRGARVGWHHYERPILFQEVMSAPGALLLVSTGGARPGVYRGQETRVHSCAVVRPGQEIHSASPSRQSTLEVYLEPGLVDFLGWEALPDGVLAPDGRAVTHLLRVCDEIRDAGHGGETSDPGALVLRDRLLLALRQLMADVFDDDGRPSPRVTKTPAAYDVARSARRVLEDRMALPMLSVGELASLVGVAKRTLYDAFLRFVGVGPYEFQVVLRMHAARRALLLGGTAKGRVRRAGAEVGFDDPVKLSKSYRRCFGESPRETLQRRQSP